jgi:PAS domain S-box-containing protein
MAHVTNIELQERARLLTHRLSAEFLGAITVLTMDGIVVFWNEGAETLYGYAASEVVGRRVLDFVAPPELIEAMQQRLALAATSASGVYEMVRQRKDGLRIWVDINMRVVSHDDGSRLLVLNERDITRVKYRREAQVLQTRFREVLEAAPDAIVIVDASGRIALVNSEAERLFEYGRDELFGELVELLVPARFHRGHPRHRGKYFTDPHTRPMGTGLELSGRRKNGAEFPVEISLCPLSIDGSTLAMAAIRDVSGRKRIEQALKAAHHELEAFMYSVSHDLRAPIRQIDGFAKILTEHLGPDLDDRAAHYLRRIQDGTQHMGRLVDDLLNLAQLGRQDIRPRRVALGDLVNVLVAEFRVELGARTIEWRVGQLPTLECDPGLMRVVFTNLLSNAVKYTRPRAHPLIEIGEIEREGAPAVFVRDNGVGFDLKYADKLFGVFQRLHRPEDFEGTGVGLATVQRIIHKHGGRIWAEAEPDHGATFVFTLGSGLRTGGTA